MEQLQYQRESLPLVLIVNDNSTIRMLLAHSLHCSGFQPVEVADGREATQWMERAASELLYPAVILLDLAMPGMDGLAFLQWLQTSWSNDHPTPAIILITASFIDKRMLAFFPSIKQTVSKPFHIRDLVTIVRRWSV